MYALFGILLILFLFFFIINHHRKKYIIKKICSMTMEEKCNELNYLIEPFGYCYDNCQDIFSSTQDAWQKEFGYSTLYDELAPHFNMVFDSEPVYFNYNNRTWLIEFWKGQYGINTGGEIGVYYTDTIVPKEEWKNALFYGASQEDMLDFSIHLFRNEKSLVRLSSRHWWLTAFCMGEFTKPKKLCMEISITFPDCEMMNAFICALTDRGYSPCDLCICDLKVSFTFRKSSQGFLTCFQKLSRAFAQWKNKWFCRIYLHVTKPFTLSLDRLLYLYFYLPFAFRRMIQIRRYKKQKKHKKCKR